MNCLLVMPRLKVFGIAQYAVGLGHIAAALKLVDGLNLSCVNLNHLQNEDVRPFLRSRLEEEAIDIVMTGGLSPSYFDIRVILETAKAHNPGIVTVAGGGMVTCDPPTAMAALEFADYGIIGEGEITVAELARALMNKNDPADIPGLVHQQAGLWRCSAPRPETDDLAALPRCDYEAFDYDAYLRQEVEVSYWHYDRLLTQPALHLATSRACPFRCTFCFHPEGDRYRLRKLDDVFAELDGLVARYPLERIYFVDEMIGLDDGKLNEFCRRLKNYAIPWTTHFRPSDLTPEKARLLKDSGCRNLFMGLESMNADVLKSMKKGVTPEQIQRALAAAAEANLLSSGNFIFGDPAETLETARETLEWYLAHPQYNIHLIPVYFYPGTALYRRALAEGKIADPVDYLKIGPGYSSTLINCTRLEDDDFLDLMNRLLPQYVARRYKRLPVLREARLEIPEGAEVFNVRGGCARCGAPLVYERVPLLSRWDPLLCDECGASNALIPPAYERRLQSNLRFLAAKYGRVAFWGRGVCFAATVDEELVADEAFYFIDARPAEGGFGGHQVHGPELLEKEAVGLIIMVEGYKLLGQPYPALDMVETAARLGIRRLIHAHDLYNRDFALEEARLRSNLHFLRDRRLAFWGIGRLFRGAVDEETLAGFPNIFLVDRRCGAEFGGRLVESPESLAQNGIEVLVIPPDYETPDGRHPSREIADEARSRYGLTDLIDFNDLFRRDLSEEKCAEAAEGRRR